MNGLWCIYNHNNVILIYVYTMHASGKNLLLRCSMRSLANGEKEREWNMSAKAVEGNHYSDWVNQPGDRLRIMKLLSDVSED